jgi:hypothetical protein
VHSNREIGGEAQVHAGTCKQQASEALPQTVEPVSSDVLQAGLIAGPISALNWENVQLSELSPGSESHPAFGTYGFVVSGPPGTLEPQAGRRVHSFGQAGSPGAVVSTCREHIELLRQLVADFVADDRAVHHPLAAGRSRASEPPRQEWNARLPDSAGGTARFILRQT